jgi:hypothetical protein
MGGGTVGGRTDKPTIRLARSGKTNGPRTYLGPLEEAVGEREDGLAHEALGGVAKQEDPTFVRMLVEATAIDYDTDAVDTYCAPALPV